MGSKRIQVLYAVRMMINKAMDVLRLEEKEDRSFEEIVCGETQNVNLLSQEEEDNRRRALNKQYRVKRSKGGT